MKGIIGFYLCCLCFLGGAYEMNAQESEQEFRHHRISLIMSNAHVPKAIGANGKATWLVLNSWGIDYDYHFNKHWALSLQSDIIIGDFIVEEFETGNKPTIERSYPVALVLAGLYSFNDHLTLIAGGGIELAPEENLGIMRIGLDYEWELTEVWGISLNLMYDLKLEIYDTWCFGVGVNRRF